MIKGILKAIGYILSPFIAAVGCLLVIILFLSVCGVGILFFDWLNRVTA
jgi:hypothetical protein